MGHTSQEDLADRARALYEQQCRERTMGGRGELQTWTVVVRVDATSFQTHTVQASTPQERADQMHRLGIDTSRGKFAYGTNQRNIGGNDVDCRNHLRGMLPR